MIDTVFLPSGSVLTAKGDSPAVEIAPAENRVFLLTLKISEAVEQEYLELSLQGSADGITWGTAPLATLPQRFYVGEYPALIDLTAEPQVNFLRVHWELSRWGRGELNPRFTCELTLREVASSLLREARAAAPSFR